MMHKNLHEWREQSEMVMYGVSDQRVDARVASGEWRVAFAFVYSCIRARP